MNKIYARFLFASASALLAAGSAIAQIPPVKKDPLHPVQIIQGTGACSATETSNCAEAASKILPIVMGDSPLEENLRRLTDEVGGRVSGTPQMAKAAEWAVGAFRAAGVDVHIEKFTLPSTWSEGETKLEILGPVQFPVQLVSVGWSPAIQAGGVEATLLDVGTGSEMDFAKAGNTKGALLLVHTELGATWADLFNEYKQPPAIIQRAVDGGAVAILWMGERARKLLYRHQNTNSGQFEAIPQAVVAREDAMRLARLVAAHPGTRVKFSMPNRTGVSVEEPNVVAEIKGYEKPDETVILAAHLDSWDLGTGALDNGCDAALVIEAARALKATGLLPRRSIRFILFSGEEQGMLGSWKYVNAHRAELDKIRAVVVFDSGVGRVTGYSLSGRSDFEPALREILKPLASWDVNQHTQEGSIGTDNWDFLLEGVPTLVANNEVSNYLENYHAASDTFDKVDIRELKLQTALAALTVWGIADKPGPFGKRYSRSEIESQLKATGLDEDMKRSGFWEGWMNSERGRQPQ